MWMHILLFALAAYGITAAPNSRSSSTKLGEVAKAPRGTPRRSNSAEVKAAQFMFEQVKLQVADKSQAQITPAIHDMIQTMITFLDAMLVNMKTDLDDTQVELNSVKAEIESLSNISTGAWSLANQSDHILIECRSTEKDIKIQEEIICKDRDTCWENCNIQIEICLQASKFNYTLSSNHDCNLNPDGTTDSASCPKQCVLQDIVSKDDPTHDCSDFKEFSNDVDEVVSNFEEQYDKWRALQDECDRCKDDCTDQDQQCTNQTELWEKQRSDCNNKWHAFRYHACNFGTQLSAMCSRKTEFDGFRQLVTTLGDTTEGDTGTKASEAFKETTSRDEGLSETDRRREYVAIGVMRCILESYDASDGTLSANVEQTCSDALPEYNTAIGTLITNDPTTAWSCDSADNWVEFSGSGWTIGSKSEHYTKYAIQYLVSLNTNEHVFDMCKEYKVSVSAANWTDSIHTVELPSVVLCGVGTPELNVILEYPKQPITVTTTIPEARDDTHSLGVSTRNSLLHIDLSNAFDEMKNNDDLSWQWAHLATPPELVFMCEIDTKFYTQSSAGFKIS